MIVATYVKDASTSLEQERRCLESLLQDKVRQLMVDIEPGTNPLRWLFASRDAKNQAEKSYNELKSLIDGDLGTNSKVVAERLEALKNTQADRAWEWYEKNEISARATIENVYPGVLGDDIWPLSSREACDALERVRGALRSLDSHSTKPEFLSSNIVNAVQRYLGNRALASMKDIPVEELNREKLGIRIKSFKDAGYDTVADVYAATRGELLSLSGVSSSSIDDAKRQAALIAVKLKEGIKLRLSVDDQTPAAANIVCAVYATRKWDDLGTRRSAITAEIVNLFKSFELGLKPATKKLVWLFAAEEVREDVEVVHQRLLDFIDGDLLAEAESLIRQYEQIEAGRVDPNEAWSDFAANSVATFNVLEELVPDVLGSNDVLFGLPEELAREIQDECFFPEGLKCTLRRYQEMGVKYILHQERALLGDEMGLGKTVQAIATMVSLKNTGETHFAVICPASVLENWCREIRKHSKLRVTKVHGASGVTALDSWLKSGGVAVTTYETTKKLQLSDEFMFGLAVVDEAHYIKNPGAARSANTLRLIASARRVVFMTGTALENRVDEMLTLIGYLRPDVAEGARPLAFMASAQRFRDEVAPVYYRRKREDVLTELPELIESEEWCTLGPVEEEAYERSVLTESFMAARRVSWNVDNPEKYSSKARRLLEIISDATDDGRKVLVFTFFLDTASKVAELLDGKCAGIINGSVQPAKRQAMVEDFDAAPAGSVLVAQIQSAGTGMNIQSASVVVFCEPQFKPSIESQAVSRAYRMGQTRNVLAFKLLCEGTIDEKIQERVKEKQAAFDAFADKSSAAAAAVEEAIAIDSKSQGEMIREEIERIKAKNPEFAERVMRERTECLEDEKPDPSESASSTSGSSLGDVTPICSRRVKSQNLIAKDPKVHERGHGSCSSDQRQPVGGEINRIKEPPDVKPTDRGQNDDGPYSRPRFCTYCGKEYKAGMLYCAYCGKKIEAIVRKAKSKVPKGKCGYFFWDSETANPQQRICQVAYCLTDFGGNLLAGPVVNYINPESEFSPWNTRIHGIREADVAGARTFDEFWEAHDIPGLLRDYIFVAHNAKSADLNHMRKSLAAYGLSLPEVMLFDTMRMAQAQGLPGKLEELCNALGVDLSCHHDAGADVAACRDCFWKLDHEGCSPEVVV